MTEAAPAMGVLETDVDTAWFSVDLLGGQSYRIEINQHDVSFGLVYSNGSFVVDAQNGSDVVDNISYALITLEFDETFYVQVAGLVGTPDNLNYTIALETTVLDLAEDTTITGVIIPGVETTSEFAINYDADWFAVTFSAGQLYNVRVSDGFGNDLTLFDASTSGVLILGQSANVSVDYSGDSDAFAFTVAAGQVYQIVASDGAINARNGFYDNDYSFFGANDQALTGGERQIESGYSGEVIITANSAGTYYVNIQGSAAFGEDAGYTVSFNQLADDFAGDVSTVATLALGQSLAAQTDFRLDADWFGFSAQEGVALTFDVSNFGFQDGFWTFMTRQETLFQAAFRRRAHLLSRRI